MDEKLLKEIMYEAHMKALSKSLSKKALKEEASNYEPMTMLGVGHVQTIIKEIIEKYNLTNSQGLNQ